MILVKKHGKTTENLNNHDDSYVHANKNNKCSFNAWELQDEMSFSKIEFQMLGTCTSLLETFRIYIKLSHSPLKGKNKRVLRPLNYVTLFSNRLKYTNNPQTTQENTIGSLNFKEMHLNPWLLYYVQIGPFFSFHH